MDNKLEKHKVEFKEKRKDQLKRLFEKDIEIATKLNKKLLSKTGFRKKLASNYKLPDPTGELDLTLDEITNIYIESLQSVTPISTDKTNIEEKEDRIERIEVKPNSFLDLKDLIEKLAISHKLHPSEYSQYKVSFDTKTPIYRVLHYKNKELTEGTHLLIPLQIPFGITNILKKLNGDFKIDLERIIKKEVFFEFDKSIFKFILKVMYDEKDLKVKEIP